MREERERSYDYSARHARACGVSRDKERGLYVFYTACKVQKGDVPPNNNIAAFGRVAVKLVNKEGRPFK